MLSVLRVKCITFRLIIRESCANDILEIVHTDLNGPHATTGYSGEKYFLTFIDDYSKLAKIYCIKSKSEVYNCFVDYVNQVENLTNKRIKVLRCDNGREYINSNVFKFAREKGICVKPSPPYVHELNGVAERYNRSIMDMSRCLLAEAKVNRIFWPEVVKAATYLKNRSLANTFERKTPYEIFFNKKPSAKYLKLYGSRIYVRVPEQLRNSRWDNKAEPGVLLGYSEVGYRILINNKIVEARYVDIIEEDIKCICFNENENTSDNCSKVVTDEAYPRQNTLNTNASQEVVLNRVSENDNNESESELIRSNRTPKPNSRYFNDNVVQYVYVNFCNAIIPNTFEEAIKNKDSKHWKRAMDSEINSLKQSNTWKLVDKPKNKNVIDVKWIFRKKNDENFKARLVVRGFQQREFIDNIFH